MKIVNNESICWIIQLDSMFSNKPSAEKGLIDIYTK